MWSCVPQELWTSYLHCLGSPWTTDQRHGVIQRPPPPFLFVSCLSVPLNPLLPPPLSSLSLPPAAFLPSLLSFIPFLLISKRGWRQWLMWTHRCSSAVAAKIISCALCIRQSKYKSAEYTGNWTPAREKKGKKHKKTMRFCFCLTIFRSLMRMWRYCLPAVALCLLNWALARFRAAGWLSQSSTPTVLYTQPCQYLIWMHPGQHSFPSQAATQPASSQMEIYYFLLSTFWGH